MKLKIYYRGRHLWPLICIGHHKLWLSSGIAFGIRFNASNWIIFIGHLIISFETEYNSHIHKMICNGTWPEKRIWVLKHSKL